MLASAPQNPIKAHPWFRGARQSPEWLKRPQVPVPVYPDNKPNPLADCILWCLGLVFGVRGSPSRGKVLPESFSEIVSSQQQNSAQDTALCSYCDDIFYFLLLSYMPVLFYFCRGKGYEILSHVVQAGFQLTPQPCGRKLLCLLTLLSASRCWGHTV